MILNFGCGIILSAVDEEDAVGQHIYKIKYFVVAKLCEDAPEEEKIEHQLCYTYHSIQQETKGI